MNRGQVSVEYLMIIGVALGLLIPGIMFFYSYSKSATGEGDAERINDLGLRSIAAAKQTYALGVNSRQTIEFVMPDTVRRVYVSGQEMTIVYETSEGLSEAVFFSPITLQAENPDGSINPEGNISTSHPGLTKYRFVSAGTEVRIAEVVGS